MSYANVYRQTSINTASGPQLLLMLYNGLVRFTNQAIQHITADELESAHRAIVRAQDILIELRSTLNHEVAPELSASLDDLYAYFYKQLVQANVTKEAGPIEEILPHILGLQAAFTEASKQLTVTGSEDV